MWWQGSFPESNNSLEFLIILNKSIWGSGNNTGIKKGKVTKKTPEKYNSIWEYYFYTFLQKIK